MRRKRRLRSWIWPPPPIARRLWMTILFATGYSAGVYIAFHGVLDRLPGWSSEFGLVNGIVLGVLVAIRIRSAFDRWFEGQKVWADLTTHLRNFALKVAYLVRAEDVDRQRALALGSGFAVALARHLRDRELPPSPPGPPEMQQPGHLPAHVAGRMYALAAGWHKEGKVDLPGLWALEANIRALMDVTGVCERIASTPVPISFHTLLHHGLILSLLLAPWHLIHTLGLWALPVQGLIIYFLFGVELTAEEIENPFGTDTDDLPLSAYCRSIHRDLSQILAVGGSGPGTTTDQEMVDLLPGWMEELRS